jgi:hypothetical protein
MSQQQYQNYNNGNYKLINFNVPHYLINNFDEIVKFKRISRTSVLIGLMERYIRAEHQCLAEDGKLNKLISDIKSLRDTELSKIDKAINYAKKDSFVFYDFIGVNNE